MTKMTMKKTMMTEMSAVVVTILLVSQHALGVEVYEGAESVTLPCQVSDPVPEGFMVVWSRKDLTDSIVHARQQSGDVLEDQNQNYINRTSMRPDSLKTGNLSLILRNPTTRDSDNYTCIIREKGVDKSHQEVHLKVTGECPPPPPSSPWPVVVAVVVTFLVCVTSGCFIGYKWRKEREVQQVEVEEGAESVQLPVNTNIWWYKMKMLLRCAAPRLPGDVRVEWTDHHHRMVHEYQNGSVEQEQVYRDRTEMNEDLTKTGDFSLILKHLRVPDSGKYTCRVYSKDGDLLREKQVTLLVPVLQVEVESGVESVQLSFTTTGDLPEDVRVEWMDHHHRKVHVYQNGSDWLEEQEQVYKDRTEMKKDLKTGDFSLILKEPRVPDSGRFTCRVYNKDGDLLREKQVTLLVPGLQVEVEEGKESVQLSFKTTANLSEDVRVEWKDEDNRKVHVYQNGSVEQELIYRGRTEMKKDLMKTGDFSLILRHPRVRDTGDYTCRVYKDGNILMKKQVFLSVKVQKVKVESGAESVQLPFKTTSHLPEDVRVEWRDEDDMKVHVYENDCIEQNQIYRGRTKIKEDLMKTGDFSLILKHITQRDSDTFTCTVSSRGEGILMKKQVELLVTDQQVEVESGAESVLLSFKTTSDLPEDVRVEWRDEDNMKVHVYQNGSVEQDQVYRGRTEMKKDLKTGDFILILKHPTARDSGRYHCSVFNKDRVFLREKTLNLKVKEKTQVRDETVDVWNRKRSPDSTPLMADQSV